MAKDLYDHLEDVKQTYENANQILGFDLADICFNGPEEKLRQTRVTQPAIFVHSTVLVKLLFEKNSKPEMAAGHSLGEYSALYAAEALTFEDGLRLVKVRAELMQKASELNEGTMAAFIGLQEDVVAEVCETASSVGVVQVANFNSPGQVVISGSVAGVNRAIEIAKEKGAKRAIPLVVGGAFHSPLMEYASEGLQKALAEVEIRPASMPVYSNVHAKPVTQPDEIKQLLAEQLTSPVRWVEIVESMIQDGATEFHEVGPGSVLTGLLRRINREVTGKSIDKLENLQSY